MAPPYFLFSPPGVVPVGWPKWKGRNLLRIAEVHSLHNFWKGHRKRCRILAVYTGQTWSGKNISSCYSHSFIKLKIISNNKNLTFIRAQVEFTFSFIDLFFMTVRKNIYCFGQMSRLQENVLLKENWFDWHCVVRIFIDHFGHVIEFGFSKKT